MILDFLNFKNEIKLLYEKNNITEKSELDWLFCHVLKCERTKLLTLKQITKKQAKLIQKYAHKRILGMPLDKIIKQAYFYGEPYFVNCNVLTPRKETEILAEKVILDSKNKTDLRVLDLCTGSGILAVTIKKHLNASVVASDISRKALKVAKKNAKQHNTKIQFVKSDLFDKIKGKFDVIMSNPPYIKTSELSELQKEVKNFDPALALDGGTTGYSFYKRIIRGAMQKLKPNGILYFELGIGQSETVKRMLEKHFYNIEILKDYNQIDRVIVATKKDI